MASEQRLEQFLKASVEEDGLIFRDRAGRIILAAQEAVDIGRLSKSRSSLLELGVRFRLMSSDMTRELGVYLAPFDLIEFSERDPKMAEGCVTPIGEIVFEQGLYLKYGPGIQEVGVNDRGDMILRMDGETVEGSSCGAIRNSVNTVITGRAKRLVTRTSRADQEADIAEAGVWLKAMEVASGRNTLVSRFKCAGIDYEHVGNVPYLNTTTQINFFDPNDPEMMAIAGEVAERFKRLGRRQPTVTVISLMGLPQNSAEYAGFLDSLGASSGAGRNLALPDRIEDSRFYDAASGGITSSNFVLLTPLREVGDKITIITVNTDYHGEVKSRGVLSPLMAIMSLLGIISAHAGSAVLNRHGTVTTFTGPTGTGKTTACTFWAEAREGVRRAELKHRYLTDRRRLGASAGEALTRASADMKVAGILCQEDWIEITREDNGTWVYWPTERMLYARTGGFPSLAAILAENEPLLENAAADFGASGRRDRFGKITHDFFPERLFYDPEWGHIRYDRSPRVITANVFLERNAALDFCVKRVDAEEAIRWLLLGRTPSGKFEPLYNAYPDFSGLLMERGVVGEKLLAAYEQARNGDFSLLGSGDSEMGEAIFDKLDTQVSIWTGNCSEIPTYIVNGAPGLEITQDINWLLSEHPEAFGEWEHVTEAAFKTYMQETYGVTYGNRGEWIHIERDRR